MPFDASLGIAMIAMAFLLRLFLQPLFSLHQTEAFLTKNNDTSVIVKDWGFTNPPSGPVNHPYIVGVDVTDLPGIAGQGNPDPPGSFNGHWITKSGGYYYDPSYGTSPVNQGNIDKNYENAAFAGFGADYIPELTL